MSSGSTATSADVWELIECRDAAVAPCAHLIADSEVLVGRAPPATIVVDSPSVSKRHAILTSTPRGLLVRDLGSTNGTFINGSRIVESLCAKGDMLQFAKTMFRVNRRGGSAFGATQEGGALPYAASLLEFELLMNGNGVVPAFQPIVDFTDKSIVAYELLARSTHEHLRSPQSMFATATLLGQECQLSELMRSEGVRIINESKGCPNLFVNTHPKEVINPRLLASLSELRKKFGGTVITLEIHEAAIANRDEMREFRSFLRDHAMLLAFDDFGAGQARLDELSEVAPDYLKFDIKLIRDLDKAAPARRSMIETLVRMTCDLGTCPLAEGVETASEASTCQEVGFKLAQGYFFGRPQPWPKS